MNIYLFELKTYTKSIIIWGLSVSFGLFIYMAFFPSVAADSTAFEEMMALFPQEVSDMMGINPDLPAVSILGYFSLTMSFILIPLAIQASNYGFHMLSVEERELTADFLLTKPVSRTKIIISKFFAGLSSLIIVNLIIWATSLAAIALFRGDQTADHSKVIVFLSSLILFQLFFMSVGMVISVSVKKVSSVLSFSMALGFGMYILSSMGTMIGLDAIQYISPYSHFDPGYILVEGHYNPLFTFISVIIIIGSLVASYFLYLRRNIASL